MWPLDPALARPALGVLSILVFVPGISCPRAVTAMRRGAPFRSPMPHCPQAERRPLWCGGHERTAHRMDASIQAGPSPRVKRACRDQ